MGDLGLILFFLLSHPRDSLKPSRTKTANCFGIYYGDGQGLDACNIFARVVASDRQKLIDLGNSIWKDGAQELTVSLIDHIGNV